MNDNELAKAVTLLEGKKKILNIADVKEVLRCEKEVVRNLPVTKRIAHVMRRFFS